MANEFRIKNGAITPNMVVTDTTVSTSKTTGSVQVAGGVGISGNVYANAFYGPGTGLTSIPGANVSGEVLTANTVSNPSQSNITSVGTLSGLTSGGVVNITNATVSTSTTTGALKVSGGLGVAGNIYAGAFYGAATGLTSIPGANVSGAVPSATVAATVTTAAQSNITSVGTLTGLTSSGAVSVSNTLSTTLSSGANASAFNASYINGTNIIRFIGNTVASSWNSLAQQNDMVLLFNSGSSDTGALCIMPWSSTASGIRLTPGNNGISGNVSVASNGTLSVANAAASTSTITGSIKTSGGLGVAGNIYAGAFYGPGTGLTSIPGANVSGEVLTANTVSNP